MSMLIIQGDCPINPNMPVSFKPLFKLLIDRELTKGDLKRLTGLSGNVIAKLGKNETVTTETLYRICKALGCQLSDIMELNSDDEPGQNKSAETQPKKETHSA